MLPKPPPAGGEPGGGSLGFSSMPSSGVFGLPGRPGTRVAGGVFGDSLVAEGLGLGLGVTEEPGVVVGVLEDVGEAGGDPVVLGVAVGVLLRGVPVGVAVLVGLGVSDGPPMGVRVAEGVGVRVDVTSVGGTVCVPVGVAVAVRVGVPVGVGVAVTVRVPVGVIELVGVAVNVRVAVGVLVDVTVPVGVRVGVAVTVGVLVGVEVRVGVGTVGVTDGCAGAQGPTVRTIRVSQPFLGVDLTNVTSTASPL